VNEIYPASLREAIEVLHNKGEIFTLPLGLQQVSFIS